MTLMPGEIAWLLVCSGLAALAPAGLACLAASRGDRARWTERVQKVFAGVLVGVLAFWCVGAGLMHGESLGGWLGRPGLRSLGHYSAVITYLLYHSALGAAALGAFGMALAGRLRYGPFLGLCGLLGGFLFPLVGHWSWGGSLSGGVGWLREIGLSTSSGLALINLMVTGTVVATILMTGRSNRDSSSDESDHTGRIIPSILGGSLLLVAWLGINGGASIRTHEQFSLVLLNTALAASAGGLACWCWVVRGQLSANRAVSLVSGVVGGLVASSAVATVATPLEAVLVGSVAGFLGGAGTEALTRWVRPNEASVVGAYGLCALFGLIIQPVMSGTGSDPGLPNAIAYQLLGAAAVALTSFTVVLIPLALVGAWVRLDPDPSKPGTTEAVVDRLWCELLGLFNGSNDAKRLGASPPLPPNDHSSLLKDNKTLLSEKQKAETFANALEASQASLALAMNGGDLGLWHWDVSSGYFELSANWLRRLGREGCELDSDIVSFRELLHEDGLVFWSPEDAASLAPEEPYDREFRVRVASGDYRWVQVLGKATAYNQDGSPESLSGILLDIHERKETETRNAGMARIIENSLNEVYLCDAQTNLFIEVNRGARENLGYAMEELRTMTPIDIKPDITLEERQELLRPILSGEADRLEFESINRRKDGSTYPVLLSLQKGRLLDRDVIVAIGIDLTHSHQLEQQLAEAQRLEAIGQLAAGVAHEMNTPLQYLGNNMKFLNDCSAAFFEVLDAYADGIDMNAPNEDWRARYERVAAVMERTRFSRIRAEVPQAIHDSLVGVERVLEIVRAMKEFSHPGSNTKHPTDLNRAIKSTTTITRNRWKDAAELELELDPDLPHVECEGSAINQVFVNLVVNAADAIVDRRAKDPDPPPGRIVIRTWAEEDRVFIEVEDNGCGMPESVRQRAFEPFYTTKDVGKGTGQGLFLSHTIVAQRHGGSISISSAPQSGTVFLVSLPITDESTPNNVSDKNNRLVAVS